MSKTIRAIEGSTVVARWAGRLLGLGIVGLVVLFLIGTGGFNPMNLGLPEALEMVFLFTTCAGLLLAWRWEWMGGALAIAGVLLFQLVEFVTNGRLFNLWLFGAMLLAGALMLLSQVLGRASAEPSAARSPS
jgi:hypothetical protein